MSDGHAAPRERARRARTTRQDGTADTVARSGPRPRPDATRGELMGELDVSTSPRHD